MRLSTAQLIRMLEQMLKIRRFEEKIKEVHTHSIPGSAHLYMGQEAVAVGVCAALDRDDVITSTHRGHGHCIAKGADLKPMMAELYGKRTGTCRGKGGSMHVADVSLGILGANGIVGGGLSLAVGAGLASRIKGDSTVAVCFFGDGAANQGALAEGLNLSAAWRLPVVFVCENNLYQEFSPSAPVTAGRIVDRAQPYGAVGMAVDGMDLLAVYQATREAVDRARQGEGPTLIEASTYRFDTHSVMEFAFIGTTYRELEEEQSWLARDPIGHFSRWLVEEGHCTPAEIAAVESRVQVTVGEAEAFAEASPFPEPGEAFEHVLVG
jgi:TPP-dependent pyruvate/acetoin dehydrogenase alpha subunit